MVVIKRNGSEVSFDKRKIDIAISKANGSVEDRFRLTDVGVTKIIDTVVGRCEQLQRAPSVEEIQDMVEKELMASGAYEVAKNYITYRYEHAIARGDDGRLQSRVSAIVNLENEEAIQENANKNPIVNSTQRDYMASEVSEDIVRNLLPKDIVKAHDDGIIRFHDIGYSAGHMDNCFDSRTRFMTNTGIRSFSDFKDGDTVMVPSLDGKYHRATVHNYGEQDLYEYTFVRSYDGIRLVTQSVVCTENHRWILADGTSTTSLSIGDVIAAAPEIQYTPLDWETMTPAEKRSWCFGVASGVGSIGDNKDNNAAMVNTVDQTIISRFSETDGCRVVDALKESYPHARICIVDDPVTCMVRETDGTLGAFLDGVRYVVTTASWPNKRVTYHRSTPWARYVVDRILKYGNMAGLYVMYIDGDYDCNSTAIKLYLEISPQSNFVVVNKAWDKRRYVWCLEVEDTHNFILDGGIPTSNCRLVNLEDMLQNGTVINNTLIEKPHSFSTACNIATQVIAVVASNSLGGQTISLAHLAPFVDVSRQKLRKDLNNELGDVVMSDEQKNSIVEQRLREEIRRGVQMIQYQVLTLFSTNGQTPFVTTFMYLGEARSEREKADLAMIIEETLKQRIEGVKNEQGVWITPAFPKLVYVTEDGVNIEEGDPYWYLTVLAAKCTAKRMVPDYVSAAKMIELKGDVYAPMGCRSFLTPDRFTDAGIGNVAKAKNYEEGKHKYYGRMNLGVVTLSLPDIALSSGGDYAQFWKIFDERLELCHRALRWRIDRMRGTPSDVAPILWQYGANARLEKGEPIDKLLYNGYATISLGYAGLYECVKYMTGQSHSSKDLIDAMFADGEMRETTPMEFGLAVMQHLNDACFKWKADENVDYSVYGTPIESATYTFAKCLQKRFGIIEGITDRSYITNSYHIPVFEPIDAFSKISIEDNFQKLSPGGAITYVEVPNMQNNIPAVLAVIKFIHKHLIYGELNTKSDYCQVCGWDGEIDIVENDDHKLIWKCPKCGNTDQRKMNVARRVCGYIGTNFFNQGRTQEINERVLHL